MSDPLEAAAEKAYWFPKPVGNPADFDWDGTSYEAELEQFTKTCEAFLVEWMRDAIGCPECGGTGWVFAPPGNVYGPNTMRCPAEHVEIPFLGETIWADPDKCEWRCVEDMPMRFRPETCGPWVDPTWPTRHDNCGWQPEWSAIKGDET